METQLVFDFIQPKLDKKTQKIREKNISRYHQDTWDLILQEKAVPYLDGDSIKR